MVDLKAPGCVANASHRKNAYVAPCAAALNTASGARAPGQAPRGRCSAAAPRRRAVWHRAVLGFRPH